MWKLLSALCLLWSHAPLHVKGKMAFSKARQGCDQEATLVAGVSSESSSLSRLCTVSKSGYGYCYDFESGTSFSINSGRLTIFAIACTATHVCVINYWGYVGCQGSNSSGQLGTGDTTSRSVATRVDLGSRTAVAVSAGGFDDRHQALTCVLLDDGNVSCFGYGFGSFPTLAYTGGDAVGIEVSNFGADGNSPPSYCILKIDGSVKCDWANTAYDYEGYMLGKTATSLSSRVYPSPLGCATFDDNTMACWGAEDSTSPMFPPSANIQAQPSDILSLPAEAEGAVYVDFVANANCFLGGSGNVYCRTSDQSKELHTVVDLGGRTALAFALGSDALGYALLDDYSFKAFSPSGNSYSASVANSIAAYANLAYYLIEGNLCPSASQLTPLNSLTDALRNSNTRSYSIKLSAGTFTLSTGYAVSNFVSFTLQGSAVPGETIIECGDAIVCMSIQSAEFVTISDVTFRSSRRRHDRRAQASSTGHALQLESVRNAVLSNVVFDGLSGDDGAALRVTCASSSMCQSVFVTESSFIGNSASEYGGAVYLDLGLSTVAIQFKDTLFTDNTAGVAGGAVYIKRSAASPDDCTATLSVLTFSGSTFTNNAAGSENNDKASDVCSLGMASPVNSTSYESGDLVYAADGQPPTVLVLDAFGQTITTTPVDWYLDAPSGPEPVPLSAFFALTFGGASSYPVINGVVVIEGLRVRTASQNMLRFYPYIAALGSAFMTEFDVKPKDCQAGKYRDVTALDESIYTCVNCVPGYLSTTLEAATCSICPANTYCAGGSTVALPCPPLTTSTLGSGACICDDTLLYLTEVRGCTDTPGSSSTTQCPTAGGVSLSVKGGNFGTSDAYITIGGNECVITHYEMDYSTVNTATCTPPSGTVICTLPPGVGLSPMIVITDISGTVSGYLMSYAAPVIQTVSGCTDDGVGGTADCPRSGGVQSGTYITVTGTNFGTEMASVMVGGIVAGAAPDSVTAGIDVQTTAIAVLPAGSGTSKTVNILQRSGEISGGVSLLSYATCGAGMYNVLASAADSTFTCVSCEIGLFNEAAESYACEPCPAGYFCSTSQSFRCTDFVPGSTSPPQSSAVTDCSCPANMVLATHADGSKGCAACVEGLVCNSKGVTLEAVTVLPGYWRTSATSLDVRACPENDACAGSLGGGDELCSENRRGAYCSVCEKGYTMSYSGQCKACEGGTTAAPLAVLSVFAVLAAAFALVRKTNGGTEAEDVSGEVGDSGNSPGKELASTVEARPADIASSGPGLSIVSTIFKVVVTFLQILTAMEGVFLVQFPAGFKNMLTSLSFVNLSILKMVSIDCVKTSVNFHSEVLFKTLAPLIVGAIVICFTAVRRQSGPERWQRCQTTLLVLTYLVLPGVATAVFRTFPCESFDDGTSWLRADYSIDCDGAEHKTMIAYAAFMVLCYPIGVPCLYGWLLYRNRKALYPDGIDGLPMNEQLRMRAQTSQKLEGMNFLYRSYSPQCWWYEIFETARRLLLTGFLIFILPGSPAQLGVALVIMMVSNLVARTYSPFVTSETNRLNFIAQFQTSMALLAGLLLQAQPAKSSDLTATDRSTQGALNVLLIMLVISVLCMAAYTSYFATRTAAEDTLDKLNEKGRKIYNLVSNFSPGNSPNRDRTPPLANSPGGGGEVMTPNSIHTHEPSPTGSFVSSLISPPAMPASTNRPREVDRPVRRINSRETNQAEL